MRPRLYLQQERLSDEDMYERVSAGLYTTESSKSFHVSWRDVSVYLDALNTETCAFLIVR
jgi:hypothetical protein